jgi:alpha-L-arabinofuranosidase
MKRARTLRICFLFILLASFGLPGKSNPVFGGLPPDSAVVPVIIDPSVRNEPISPFVFGRFTEMLINYYEGGLWAEMLGDRKFFYPVKADTVLSPPNSRKYLGNWKPSGAGDFIVMNEKEVFTGDHSPEIFLDAHEPRGVKQEGLSLQKDSAYQGYVILKSNTQATVRIGLIWGEGAEDRQSVNTGALGPAFIKIPFHFLAAADTKNGRLEITATGNGSFEIGAASLMPANNIRGFRAAIIAQVRDMKPGMIRWGGNFSSGYDWRNGIGDRDRRPPLYDYAWDALEANDVGTEEYLTLCDLVNATPYIGVNAGFGDAFSAARWLEYVNGSSSTPMGQWRSANGHPEPYHVKWWGIGNEMYGEWQLGHMDPGQFVIKHRLFATAMRKVDSSITIVACGASPFEIGSTSIYEKDPSGVSLPVAYGSGQDWSGRILSGDSGCFNLISEHMYPFIDSAFDPKTHKYVFDGAVFQDRIRRLPNRIRGLAEAYDNYARRMPYIKKQNIGIALDEWRMLNTSGLEDALVTAAGFHEIFRHSAIIKMAAYTPSGDEPSCLRYNATQVAIQPVGLVMKLYSNYFGSVPVAVSGNSKPPELAGITGVDRPSETSGSDTYPLDISASLKSDGKTITVSVINPTGRTQKLSLTFLHSAVGARVRNWVITGPGLKSFNEPGKQPAVVLVQNEINNFKGVLAAAPLSVNLYEFELKQK